MTEQLCDLEYKCDGSSPSPFGKGVCGFHRKWLNAEQTGKWIEKRIVLGTRFLKSKLNPDHFAMWLGSQQLRSLRELYVKLRAKVEGLVKSYCYQCAWVWLRHTNHYYYYSCKLCSQSDFPSITHCQPIPGYAVLGIQWVWWPGVWSCVASLVTQAAVIAY